MQNGMNLQENVMSFIQKVVIFYTEYQEYKVAQEGVYRTYTSIRRCLLLRFPTNTGVPFVTPKKVLKLNIAPIWTYFHHFFLGVTKFTCNKLFSFQDLRWPLQNIFFNHKYRSNVICFYKSNGVKVTYDFQKNWIHIRIFASLMGSLGPFFFQQGRR